MAAMCLKGDKDTSIAITKKKKKKKRLHYKDRSNDRKRNQKWEMYLMILNLFLQTTQYITY